MYKNLSTKGGLKLVCSFVFGLGMFLGLFNYSVQAVEAAPKFLLCVGDDRVSPIKSQPGMSNYTMTHQELSYSMTVSYWENAPEGADCSLRVGGTTPIDNSQLSMGLTTTGIIGFALGGSGQVVLTTSGKEGSTEISASYKGMSDSARVHVVLKNQTNPGTPPPGSRPTVVSAKFEACTIPVGKSTCSTTASWHIKNLVGYVDVGFYSNLSPKSDGTEIVFTRPGTYGMVYHDESVPPTTTSGFGPTVDIKCEAGSAWDGKICKAGSSSENPGTPEVPGVPGPRLILCPANVSSIVVNGSALLSAIYYNNTSVTPVCGVTPGWIDVTTKPETSWSSTNPNIISVESSDKGRVSAKGVGTAVISAKYGDKTVSRSMSVGQPGIATPIPLPPTTPKNVNELLTSFGQIDAEMLAWQAQINAQNNDKARAVQAMIEGVAMEIQKLQQKLSTPNNQSAVKLATNSISTASIYLRQTSSFLESGSYDKAQSLIVSVGALLVKADAIFDYNSTLDLE